jgi:hypothetical protein
MLRSARSSLAIVTVMLLAACDSDLLAPNRSLSSRGVSARAAAPSLWASASSPQQIVLTWTDNSRSETGWEVQKSTAGEAGPFSVLASLPANATTHTDDGLTTATSYCYRVRSFKRVGNRTTFDSFFNLACATTLGPPPARTGVDAIPRNSSVIDVRWTDLRSTEQSFRVERSSSSAGPWEVAAVLSYGSSAYTDFSRAAEAQICYRVVAVNQYGETASGSDCTVPPRGVANIAAASANAQSIDVTWTDASNVEEGYDVERSLDAVQFIAIATLLANASSYHDASVAPDTRYWYRVRARKDGGYSDFSSHVFAAAASGPPQAAVLNDAFPAGSTNAFVQWSTSSVTTGGFRIERSTDGQATWTTASTVPATERTFVDGERVPETQVCYRVFASNAAGESAASNVECTVPPARPTEVRLDNSSGYAVATWNDNSNVEDGFYIMYWVCNDWDGCWYNEGYIGPNVTGVNLGYGYGVYFDIYAVSDGGWSDYGTWAEGTEATLMAGARLVTLPANSAGSARIERPCAVSPTRSGSPLMSLPQGRRPAVQPSLKARPGVCRQ